MTSKEILKADLLDILFDNRNKQYGAYTLRKYYNGRLTASLLITFGFVFLLGIIFRPGGSGHSILTGHGGIVELTQVVIPDDIKPIEPEIKPAVQRSQVQTATEKFNTRIRIVEQTNSVMAENTQLSKVAIGNETREGEFLTTLQSRPALPGLPSTGDSSGIQKKPEIEAISSDPEFPGGMSAWIRFLQRNLQVPAELEAGDHKTVLVRFEVAVDGKVTGFEVLQSAGKSYDNEVIRALKKMPQWKPALQNGYPVSRMFTQPVTFVGTE